VQQRKHKNFLLEIHYVYRPMVGGMAVPIVETAFVCDSSAAKTALGQAA
jgi:hypothetical protein